MLKIFWDSLIHAERAPITDLAVDLIVLNNEVVLWQVTHWGHLMLILVFLYEWLLLDPLLAPCLPWSTPIRSCNCIAILNNFTDTVHQLFATTFLSTFISLFIRNSVLCAVVIISYRTCGSLLHAAYCLRSKGLINCIVIIWTLVVIFGVMSALMILIMRFTTVLAACSDRL